MIEMSYCVKKTLNKFITLDPTILTFIPKFLVKGNFWTVFGSFSNSNAAIVFAGTTAVCCGLIEMVFHRSTLMLLYLESACPTLVCTRFKGTLVRMILLSDPSSSDLDTLEELSERVYKELQSQESGSSHSLSAPPLIIMVASSSEDYLSLDVKMRRLRLLELVCQTKC